MIDSFLALTSLPNFHPAIVHFPIALLVTALLFDLGCLLLRRQVWLDRAATTLYVLGTALAGIAYLSGEKARDMAVGLSEAAKAAVQAHDDAAELVLIAFTVIALLRLLVAWRARRDKQVVVGPLRVLTLLLALAGLALLARTADRGGALVYQQGVNVTSEQTAGDELEP